VSALASRFEPEPTSSAQAPGEAAPGAGAVQHIREAAERHRVLRRPGVTRLDDPSDERAIAAMRLLLAGVALLVTVLTHPAAARRFGWLYVMLAAYTAYSAALYGAVRHHRERSPRGTEWADVGWYTLFTAMGGGAASPFFSFYFFAILVASFRSGTKAGLQVTGTSALLFTTIGYLADPGSEWDEFFLRPLYLIVIGSMMARWGGLDMLLKRRLVLLREVSTLSNPRFGADETLASVLERLRTFHDADAAVLVVDDAAAGRYTLRRADATAHDRAVLKERLTTESGELLTAFPWTAAVLFRDGRPLTVGDTGEQTAARPAADKGTCHRIAETLGCASFVSVAIRYHGAAMGRVYLTARRPRFHAADAEFLVLVFDQVMPAIEHLRLLDRLATEAGTHERQRLARDLHDGVIQPYIGLQIGLAGVLEHARPQGGPALGMLERLLGMCEWEIANLRRYAGHLKGQRDAAGEFAAGIRRIAQRFRDASGVHVDVRVPDHLVVQDRLAAEVFQMVSEALSNVRRHTRASRAVIAVERGDATLLLRVENEGEPGARFRPFTPRSLAERAAALGGSLHVSRREDDGSVVEIEIPL
jgi:signal transduction histidine kinase